MAGQSNGRAKKPANATPNGKASPKANGKANSHLNGHAVASKHSAATRKPRSSWTASLTSAAARLLTWYLIITFAFRCPSSFTQLSDSSAKVCKPYLHARSYVAPYLDPYYQTYVAPQVEKVQPYVDTLDQRVYTPVSTFTKNQYATYGAHRVEQAQKYAEAEWARTARPQIQKLQSKIYAQYEQHLGPHVKTASDAVSPHVEQTKDSAVEIYHLSILPAYEALLPYARQAYAHGHHATLHIVYPAVQSGRDATWKFVSRTLWPYVRVLYGDNVEPQLVRIRERLGRYKDQQKIESLMEAVESSSSSSQSASEYTSSTASVASVASVASSSISSSASSATESTKGGWGVFDDFFGAESSATPSEVETKTPTQPKQPQLTGAELRERLNRDLRDWQTKFAVAADKGAEDLDTRVAEITKRQIDSGVNGHGAAMIVQLEETAESTISSLKKFIKQTVSSLSEDATEEQLEQAYEKCTAKTRELGLTVKEKSQAVRNWKTTFDQQTDNLVRAAVGSTVEVLDKIHGLGLQEVGMRWAWLDGVEYADWQNYHKLRDTLNEWQAEVEAVGSKHDGLKAAHEEAAKLEDKAMAIASNMVNELVRLKDVSKWKIWAGDDSDDFTDKKVPVRAYKAAQQVLSNAQDASSQVSEAVLGSETPASESIASVVKESASSVSVQLSEKIVGSETPVAESVASAAKESVSDAASKVSEAVLGSETPTTESLASALKSQVSKASAKASQAVSVGQEEASSGASNAANVIESATKEAVKSAGEAASAASEVPKKVWGGVNAQVLAEAREIVFDDIIDDDEEGTYSEKVQSLVADAGDRASDLSRAVSQALLGATKTQGTAESVTSLASEQYAKALAAASSVLYGTQQAPLDSATSVASEQFASAVTAASYAIYGTPTPTAVVQTVRTHASSRYNEAVSIANEQFENAKSQFSVLVSGTTKPAHETMLAMIEKAYSDSLAAASERLDAALQYTESVKSYAAGPTQGYFESVSSIAASRLSEGLSHASAQFSTQPTGSPALDGARRQYYEAVGLAHARYSDFLGAASSAVYGPEQGTIESLASVASESAAAVAGSAQSYASDISESAQSGAAKAQEAAASLASQASSGVIGSEPAWTESVASQASRNWEALIAKASNEVYGAPTPWAASVYSQAGEYAAQATAQAAEQAVAVQALISELVVGREPDFTESVMARFSSAYYTGLPAAVSSVNSFASENYDAVTSYAGESYEAASDFAAEAYASASSVVESVFVPPPAIETILSNVNEQLNAAVESASVAVYGTQKGTVEQASESVVSAYASVQSKASEAIYGTAQASHDFAAVASSAQAAISEAIFGTPTATGYAATASSGAAAAASVYSSVASVASEKAANAAAAASEAIYGPEQGAVESASARLAAAVEAANSRISELYAAAATNAEAAASSASSIAAAATERVKDEL